VEGTEKADGGAKKKHKTTTQGKERLAATSWEEGPAGNTCKKKINGKRKNGKEPKIKKKKRDIKYGLNPR